MIALVATACAGALGTAVHDVRSHVYLAQAQSRHTVTATAVEDSTTFVGVGNYSMTRVNARWKVDGMEHSDRLSADASVKAGDLLLIWVNRDGKRVNAPTPTSQAGVGVAA